ncbi:MAG: CvpA family protein [Candidatus Sericytochromatia bacterium]
MSGIDVFIVLIFAYNIIMGLTQGLMKSLLGVGSFIAATLFAPLFQSILGSLLAGFFGVEKEFIGIFGLSASWMILYTILNIVSGIIIKGMNKTPLKFFDRLAGLGLGLFMSTIIVLIPILIIKAIPILKEIPAVKEPLRKSMLVKKFEPLGMPLENAFKYMLSKQKDEIMKKIKENNKKELVKILGESKEEEIKKLLKDYNIKPNGK